MHKKLTSTAASKQRQNRMLFLEVTDVLDTRGQFWKGNNSMMQQEDQSNSKAGNGNKSHMCALRETMWIGLTKPGLK